MGRDSAGPSRAAHCVRGVREWPPLPSKPEALLLRPSPLSLLPINSASVFRLREKTARLLGRLQTFVCVLSLISVSSSHSLLGFGQLTVTPFFWKRKPFDDAMSLSVRGVVGASVGAFGALNGYWVGLQSGQCIIADALS